MLYKGLGVLKMNYKIYVLIGTTIISLLLALVPVEAAPSTKEATNNFVSSATNITQNNSEVMHPEDKAKAARSAVRTRVTKTENGVVKKRQTSASTYQSKTRAKVRPANLTDNKNSSIDKTANSSVNKTTQTTGKNNGASTVKKPAQSFKSTNTELNSHKGSAPINKKKATIPHDGIVVKNKHSANSENTPSKASKVEKTKNEENSIKNREENEKTEKEAEKAEKKLRRNKDKKKKASDKKKSAKSKQTSKYSFNGIALPDDYRSISIFGEPVATKGQAVDYIISANPNVRLSCSVEKLVDLYWEEAGRENVRPDLALAQSLVETGVYSYGGDVKHKQNNFCGLGTTGGGVKGASFKTPQIGVRAHIQHLLAYTQKKKPSTSIVDPRYELAHKIRLERGMVDTWYGLNGTWATGSQYCEKIMATYQKILAQKGDTLSTSEGKKSKKDRKKAKKEAKKRAKEEHRMRDRMNKILKSNS